MVQTLGDVKNRVDIRPASNIGVDNNHLTAMTIFGYNDAEKIGRRMKKIGKIFIHE
jgi:hypothetical protein